jgi:hypothetical protein
MKGLSGSPEIRLDRIETGLILMQIPFWGLGEEIVYPCRRPLGSGGEKSATTRGREHRFRHTGDQHRGHHGIEGATALQQDIAPCFDGFMVSGRNNASNLFHISPD